MGAADPLTVAAEACSPVGDRPSGEGPCLEVHPASSCPEAEAAVPEEVPAVLVLVEDPVPLEVPVETAVGPTVDQA